MEWEEIKMEACVFQGTFDESIVYDDNMIDDLRDMAVAILDSSQEELMEQFGQYYFTFCLSSNHGKFLRALGGNLYDFLANIDSLHDHLSASYAGVKIPTFRVKSNTANTSISYNFYSDRLDLEDIIKGIIIMAAKTLFNLEIIITECMEMGTFIIETKNKDQSHLMFPKSITSSRDLIPRANEPKVSPLEFSKAFPFHMVFDRSMKFIQIGSTLRRVLKDIGTDSTKVNGNSKNSLITDFFSLSRPQINFDFESIYSRLNNAFVLTSLKDVVKPSPSIIHLQTSNDTTPRRTNLRLKGQMIYLEDSDAILFLCSPSISNIEDMRNKGLCLSDIPIHDATRDLVLLSENFQKELELTQQLGIVSDHLQKIHTELEEEMYLYNRLLYAVLPMSVARDLQENKPVLTEKFDSVTLMFSGIVDFPILCEDLDPFDIVSMLNQLYTRFDMLVDYMADYVYKVETVGDKYMTASGLPERCSNHAQVICSLALDMMEASEDVEIKGNKIKVTFGIHSGEVVGGVIGQRMPRYCLFGNAVNLTSRTETTGVKGKINVTEETYKLLEGKEDFSSYILEKRGKVQMKGKSEPMVTYFLSRPDSRKKFVSQGHSLMPKDYRLDKVSFMGFSSEPSGSLLTSQIGGNGGFKLNRNRCNSGNSMASRRSRPGSLSLSRMQTPGGSRVVSRYVTPLRSRCNSGISVAPPMNPKHGFQLRDEKHKSSSDNNLEVVEEKSKTSPASPASPVSQTPPLNPSEIENILQEVNLSLQKSNMSQ